MSLPEIFGKLIMYTSLLTPAAIFLFVNLIIATILITSLLRKKPHQPALNESHASETVKYVNFSLNIFSGLEPETLQMTAYYQPLMIETTQVLQQPPPLLESFIYRSDKEADDTTINAREEPKPDNDKMRKSASKKAMDVSHEVKEERKTGEKRRPATTTSLEKTMSFGDEGIDAKCDDFINRFKRQLKLQRLDSVLL